MADPTAKESSVRLCMGCVHIEYEEGASYAYSSYTQGKDSNYWRCKRKHWQQNADYMSGTEYSELEENLLRANTCPDFEERPNE